MLLGSSFHQPQSEWSGMVEAVIQEQEVSYPCFRWAIPALGCHWKEGLPSVIHFCPNVEGLHSPSLPASMAQWKQQPKDHRILTPNSDHWYLLLWCLFKQAPNWKPSHAYIKYWCSWLCHPPLLITEKLCLCCPPSFSYETLLRPIQPSPILEEGRHTAV